MSAFQGVTWNGTPEDRAGVGRTLPHRSRAVFAYSCFASLRPSNKHGVTASGIAPAQR
jgi:hypothetical protein